VIFLCELVYVEPVYSPSEVLVDMDLQALISMKVGI